jgi:hypothetical protein
VIQMFGVWLDSSVAGRGAGTVDLARAVAEGRDLSEDEKVRTRWSRRRRHHLHHHCILLTAALPRS